MEYTIKGLSELAGVSARTLRWYETKGLLKPMRYTDSGYRIYGPAEVNRLQQILFYRELGFPLAKIRSILDAPSFSRVAALRSQLIALTQQQARLNGLILTIKKAICEIEGGRKMTDEEKFEAFKKKAIQENEVLYGKEVREKYGNAAVNAANERVLSLTERQVLERNALESEILTGLASAIRSGVCPESPEGMRLAELHRRWCAFSLGEYDPRIHVSLAWMYTEDPRFTAYYDRDVPGCAAFLRDAILSYTQTLENK